MNRDVILDIQALRASAKGTAHGERQFFLLYVVTAEKCLARLQGLVVHGDRREWLAVTRELRVASARIHAWQITILCADAYDSAGDAASRMGAYVELKNAYERLLGYARRVNLLERTAGGT